MQPKGEEIAVYSEYARAQRAVDYLADNDFEVKALTIVGKDLRLVERITGKRSYGRVAAQGAAGGAWFGLFIGFMFLLLGGDQGGLLLLAAVVFGAGAGMLFQIAAYAMTRGKRDFTSSSITIPSSFAVLCLPEHSAKARQMLENMPAE